MITRKTLHFLEKIITFVQFFCLALFTGFQRWDCIRACLNNYPCLSCLQNFLSNFKHLFPNINCTVASIFLQIDATILTLTIALLAVIAGFMSGSHAGITYTDYFFNKRAWLYTQYRIILLSLFYLVAAVISYWTSRHYLVAGFLFCEVLLVATSVTIIYDMFKGKLYIHDEIAKYSLSLQFCEMDIKNINVPKKGYK